MRRARDLEPKLSSRSQTAIRLEAVIPTTSCHLDRRERSAWLPGIPSLRSTQQRPNPRDCAPAPITAIPHERMNRAARQTNRQQTSHPRQHCRSASLVDTSCPVTGVPCQRHRADRTVTPLRFALSKPGKSVLARIVRRIPPHVHCCTAAQRTRCQPASGAREVQPLLGDTPS